MSYPSDGRANAAEIAQAADGLKSRHSQRAAEIDAAAVAAIGAGETPQAFNLRVLEILRSDPIPSLRQSPQGARIGRSSRDASRYSLVRCVNNLLNNRPVDGLERECSDEVAKIVGRAPQGFFMPDDVLALGQRTMTAGTPSAGGYTVGTQILASEFTPTLRNQSHVVELGARVIPGLIGNATIPRQLTGAVCYWVGEGGTITQSTATFGQILATPKRLGASVPYSKQFLAQSSLQAEAFVLEDIARSMAVELDRVAIRGNGGAEPLGILNLEAADRADSVTFSGAATFAKACLFEANVGTANALVGTPAYLTT